MRSERRDIELNSYPLEAIKVPTLLVHTRATTHWPSTGGRSGPRSESAVPNSPRSTAADACSSAILVTSRGTQPFVTGVLAG